MDIDYFEQRRDEELMRAEHAACPSSRASHRGLASLYQAAIEGRRPPPELALRHW